MPPGSVEPRTIKHLTRLVVVAALLSLNGCIGAGMGIGLLARSVVGLSGDREAPPAERIASAQERALTEAHGGGPGTPVAWSDAKAGIQGTLIQDGNADRPDGCRHYRQTVILSGETLQGLAVACPQNDGAWKLLGNHSSSSIAGSSNQMGLGRFTAFSIIRGDD
jgi:surface antigen